MEEDKYKTLDSLRDTRGFLNSIKGYETDVELDTLAAIALLRRPELAKRGSEAFDEKNNNFVLELYNYIDFTFGSELIVESAMEIEALIRCAEAHNEGMDSEEIYIKYLGLEESEDNTDNLYFNRRLNIFQKQSVALNYYYRFKDDKFLQTNTRDYESIYDKKYKKNIK